ncbi:MAG: LuxR C-terminal-related transcriptional regulator, partial [Pseudonocardia sp.]
VPPEDPALALLARAGRGAAEIGAGSPARARSDLLAALDGARRLGLPLLEVQCLSLLGMAAWTAGDLTEAARTTAEATAAVRDGGWDRTGPAACVHAVAALTALGRARPGSAAEAAESGLRADAAALEPQVRFALRVARGGALFDSGEKAAGLLELQQARAELGEASVHGGLVAVSALVEHRIALRLGYGNAAAAVGVWLAARSGTTQEQLLLRAWTEAAAGAHRAARSTVDPLLGRAARPAWSGTVVEAWLVAAHVALQEGDRPAARQALRTALDRARALDLVRPFTLSPTAVRALLVDELVGGHDRGRFAGRILAVPPPGAWPAGVVLTGRERDVLSRLPSLLNLDEIAGDLSVSVNTVKSHVQSIYDKLGAGSRRRAVLAAHEQGLLR